MKSLKEIIDLVITALTPALKEVVDTERASSMGQIYNAVGKALEDKHVYGWITDVYREATGEMFCLVNTDGVLYKYPVSFAENEDVSLGDGQEVKVEFTPVKRTAFLVIREKSGRVRWMSTSCTSVVNKDGEIDSTSLFDSFAEHCRATGEYPYRTFFHRGEEFKTGQADFVGRDGNVLVTSGLYDDSEIARAEIKAREKDPGYWGESIRYYANEDPEFIEVQGISIPVYRSGILEEISTLPDEYAAAFFTNRTTLQEVMRTMDDKTFEAFTKLWGDKEAAKKWLDENVSPVNRQIAETGAISRSSVPAPVTDPVAPVVTDPTAPVEVPVTEPTTPGEIQFDLDDESIGKIAEAVVETPRIKAIIDKIEAFATERAAGAKDLNDLRSVNMQTFKTLDERLNALEKSDEEKQKEWTNNLPRSATRVRTTYRPSQIATTVVTEPVARSLQEIAEETLKNMK